LPTTTPSNLAQQMALNYTKSFSTSPFTISVAYLPNASRLVEKISNFAGIMKNKLIQSPELANTIRSIVLSQVQPIDFDPSSESCVLLTNNAGGEVFDLYDFIRLIQSSIIDIDIQTSAQEVMSAIQDDPDANNRYIVYNYSQKGTYLPDPNYQNCSGKTLDFSKAHGVSIFFVKPERKRSFYNSFNLDFALGTDWQVDLPLSANSLNNDLVTSIEWGPMLVEFTNIISPNALDDPSLPQPIAPLILTSHDVYLPIIARQ
jgi:hypothetical protein